MSKAERKERARKRKKKAFFRATLIAVGIFVVVDILFALGFCIGFQTTKQATEENCHAITAMVENVRFEKSHRQRYLRFSVNGETFSLHSSVLCYDIDQIAEKLQEAERPVHIMVFENYFSLRGRRCPAAIYDDETTYFDIADFNRYQKMERSALYILIAFMGAVLLACHVAYYIYWRATKPKLHRAKKVKI